MMTKIALALIAVALSSVTAQAAVRCARLAPDNSVVEYRMFDASPLLDLDIDGCPRDIPHKGVRWLQAPKAAPPAYDEATQVRTGPIVVVGETEVTEQYTVRDKTAQELAADLESKREVILGEIGELVLRRLCDHESRIRVLEGKTPVTWEQCRAAIKAAIP